MVNQAYFALGPLDGSPCDTLGIDNVPTYTQKPQEIKQIKVFPNPANDYFTIETENIKGNAYLYNALGQLVKQMPINDNRTIFSTNNIPNGIYFFSVANASSRYTYAIKKLIIQHE